MRLVNEIELAKRLSIEVRTLQAHRQRGGGIPFIKIGRSVRYDLEAVEKYLRESSFSSTSEMKQS